MHTMEKRMEKYNDERYEQRKEHLMNCLLDGMSLEEIIHEAALMYEAPVILTTSYYQVLVMDDAGLTVDDPVWQAAAETGYCSAENIVSFETQGITDAVLAQNTASILDHGIGSQIPRILHKVMLEGKVAAYIGIFQISHPFDETDLKTTDLLCRILALIPMVREKRGRDIYESVLGDLLHGLIPSSTVLNDRLRTAGWNVKPLFRCVLITPARSASGIGNADYICSLLRQKIPGSHTARVEEGICLLINSGNDESADIYESVLDEIAREYDLYMSISAQFRNLIHLPAYYNSCRRIRNIARKQKRKERLCHFDDVVFSALADYLTKDEKMTFSQSKYKTLLAWDHAHGSDYCRTLNVYIEQGCSVTDAAEALYVHRNTMAKRLDRITEISGLDIHNGRELIHFYLTSRMLRKEE